ncbi:uncharacterized protein LOC128274760 [Anopheles cruzii]|uniref:uncharacterized protein LOC128274760 n=1 Tax=Anopheles cruzii TaxID=68878 RepID=UPI0022EC9079|nr:uncharacterized protein LOC128274760 [Anopheles cruzii]
MEPTTQTPPVERNPQRRIALFSQLSGRRILGTRKPLSSDSSSEEKTPFWRPCHCKALAAEFGTSIVNTHKPSTNAADEQIIASSTTAMEEPTAAPGGGGADAKPAGGCPEIITRKHTPPFTGTWRREPGV